jgi:hypothetical protein
MGFADMFCLLRQFNSVEEGGGGGEESGFEVPEFFTPLLLLMLSAAALHLCSRTAYTQPPMTLILTC